MSEKILDEVLARRQRLRGRHVPNQSGNRGQTGQDAGAVLAPLLQHILVLAAGFKRIRHCALLAPAAKATRMALARKLLAMPNPQAREDAQVFMRRVAGIEINRRPY